MPSHGYLAYTQGKGVQGGCKPPAFFNADDSDDSDNSDNSDPAPPGCAVASSAHYMGPCGGSGKAFLTVPPWLR